MNYRCSTNVYIQQLTFMFKKGYYFYVQQMVFKCLLKLCKNQCLYSEDFVYSVEVLHVFFIRITLRSISSLEPVKKDKHMLNILARLENSCSLLFSCLKC